MNKRSLAILVCIVIGFVATLLAGMQNIVGGPMIGLLIGMLIVNLMPKVDPEFRSGTTFVGKKFLNWGIILAGATLNFHQVVGYGARAIPLVLFNMMLAFAIAYFVGQKLGVTKKTSVLVGGGTSICGGTAIATISGIIDAEEEDIAYAMTAIFLFDVLAALLFPYLAQAIQLTDNQFAILAGTAINDTSSVAAAEATYNLIRNVDLNTAITVKLARTTMLIPLAIIITMVKINQDSKRASEEGSADTSVLATVKRSFPWFILIFLIMALLNTFGAFNFLPDGGKFFSKAYKFLVTVALAGVGFKIQFKDLFTNGMKPILLGGLTWVVVAISSFSFIHLFANMLQ